jgi:hypothetical protein
MSTCGLEGAADFRTYEIGIRWLIDVEFPFSETCTESPLLCLSCSLRAVPRLQGDGDDSRGMKLRSSAV